MSIPGSLAEQLSQRLSDILGLAVDVEQSTPVAGGSINDAWRIDTNEGRFFLKTNGSDRSPSMFGAEADGLARLGATATLPVPRVIDQGEDHDTTWLLLEWIEQGKAAAGSWKVFGTDLARLHRNTAATFGLDRNNFIGSLLQTNTPAAVWSQFFIQRRLEPMLKLALSSKRVAAGTAFRFERLFAQLEDLFPQEPPSLLHGDLWSGNYLFGKDGSAWLIDPAVYYGHREMDIAMTRLFGTCDETFYAGYQEEWPMEPGWEDRMDLYNLYPLMVHVNLFGGAYIQQVEGILKKFT